MSNPNTPPPLQQVEIYLGKDGERFGPYTVEQFEAIKASPEFSKYTFIWDGRDAQPDWKALPKAPPPPPMTAPKKAGPGAPPPDMKAASPPSTEERRPALRGYDVPKLEAVCHDSRSVIAGKLTQVTDAGCELVCLQNTVAPAFGTDSPVVINLLDPKSGRSMNVTARLEGIHRRGDNWRLKIHWDSCPELVVQQLENSA